MLTAERRRAGGEGAPDPVGRLGDRSAWHPLPHLLDGQPGTDVASGQTESSGRRDRSEPAPNDDPFAGEAVVQPPCSRTAGPRLHPATPDPDVDANRAAPWHGIGEQRDGAV